MKRKHEARSNEVECAYGMSCIVSFCSDLGGFVTLSLEADVPLHQVQDSAGHKSPETTMRYNRTRNSLDKHATHALAVFLS